MRSMYSVINSSISDEVKKQNADTKTVNAERRCGPFLANVNSSSGSLYVVVRPFVVCLSSVCLSSVCRL